MFDSSLIKLAGQARRQAVLDFARHSIAAERAGQKAAVLAKKIACLRLRIRAGERRLARLIYARRQAGLPGYLRQV